MSLAALKAFHEMVVSGEEKAEGQGVEETRSNYLKATYYVRLCAVVSAYLKCSGGPLLGEHGCQLASKPLNQT